MAKTKQAGLYEETHKLISEIADEMKKSNLVVGNLSKAQVVHNAVLAMHKKVVKK